MQSPHARREHPMTSGQRNPRSDYFPDLSQFKMTARHEQPYVRESEVINMRLIDALLRTQDTTKAVTFTCSRSWQKRVCDAIYSFVRKQNQKLTVHRTCRKNQVSMWVSTFVSRKRHVPAIQLPEARAARAASKQAQSALLKRERKHSNA